MAAKFVVLAFLVAAAQGSAIHGGDYSSFSYGVSDPHTGDVKSQHETRHGDSVVGQYSLIDSDGTKRTVDYAADAHNGFNAVVRKDPIYAHAAPVVAVPIVHSAPVIAAAPIAHAAPLAHSYAAASPLAYAASPLAYAASPISYGAHVASPLSYAAHAAPLAYAASPLAYGAHGYAAAPLGLGYGSHLGYSKLY